MYIQLFSTFHEIHFWIHISYLLMYFFCGSFALLAQQNGLNNTCIKWNILVPCTPIYPPIHYRVHFITIGYYDDHLERKNGLVWGRQMYYRRVSGRLKDQLFLRHFYFGKWCGINMKKSIRVLAFQSGLCLGVRAMPV